MRFCVQREGAAHLRDRLTLRLLPNQHTAATADQLMVITATVRHTIFRCTVGIPPDHRDLVMRDGGKKALGC
jgi:hypothetical protein